MFGINSTGCHWQPHSTTRSSTRRERLTSLTLRCEINTCIQGQASGGEGRGGRGRGHSHGPLLVFEGSHRLGYSSAFPVMYLSVCLITLTDPSLSLIRKDYLISTRHVSHPSRSSLSARVRLRSKIEVKHRPKPKRIASYRERNTNPDYAEPEPDHNQSYPIQGEPSRTRNRTGTEPDSR